MVELSELSPAAAEGWWTLFELTAQESEACLLIGGQMMHLLVVENGREPVCTTSTSMSSSTFESGPEALSGCRRGSPTGASSLTRWRVYRRAKVGELFRCPLAYQGSHGRQGRGFSRSFRSR